jgi:hypothetical protein
VRPDLDATRDPCRRGYSLDSVARTAPQRMSRANVVLSSVALVSMDDIVSTAEVMGDRTLRSLDAIACLTCTCPLAKRCRARRAGRAP